MRLRGMPGRPPFSLTAFCLRPRSTHLITVPLPQHPLFHLQLLCFHFFFFPPHSLVGRRLHLWPEEAFVVCKYARVAAAIYMFIAAHHTKRVFIYIVPVGGENMS